MTLRDRIGGLIKDDIFNALLESELVDEELAGILAAKAYQRIRASRGGREVYIPAPDNEELCRDVIMAFNGNNHHEVCRQFDISLSTLYRYLRK